MNLYNTIYQLVCENDCVIIPDFGGFVTNSFPADVDFSRQEFCPPSRKVAFNENLSLSDGLLLNYISQTENVSWAEANDLVKSFVCEINANLAEGKSISFEGLGDFSRRTGTLVFVPESTNLLEDSFGLTSFNFPMLPSESKPHVESAIIKIKSDKDKKKGKKTKSAVVWLLSAAAVIAGLVCLSLYMGWFDKIFNKPNNDNTVLAGFGVGGNTEQVTETTEETSVIINDIDEQATEEAVETEEVITEEPFVEEVETEEQGAFEQKYETANNDDIKVHIIAGCFANYSNAENVYNDMTSKGLSATILPQDKGLYKVSVKGFANIQDACAELQGLKELTGNESLWVMKL